ncbi:MAG TPA: sulfotransferase [Rhizomicrobium sp.]|jgi:tetratricopeptide (TPR) repeat protein|nr:sulfotransferase [Rhizomicrobium sp.]
MTALRDPQTDARTVAEIETAARAGQLPLAVELSRKALAGGLVHPMLLNLRSYGWIQQGREKEALADLKLAVEIAPEDLLVRNAYGILLGRLQRWDEAMPILEGSVALAPDYAVAQFSLGWALETTGELIAARGRYERAAALDPAFAEPLGRLSSLAYRRADWDEARRTADAALALHPDNYLALTTHASVAVADGDLAGAETIVRRLIAMTPPGPLDAALARGVLGDLRHAEGRYAQAFAAYTAGNREMMKLYAPHFDMPGKTVTDYCGWLAQYFASASPAQWSAARQTAPADPRDGATGHVFLVGFPRSGTTLLENVLASHPGIATLEERDMLGDATREFLADAAGRDRLAGLDDATIADWRARYWARVREHGAEVAGKVFVDKYPLTMMKLPLVAKLFPGARILFALRDPRDVILSCYRRSFGMNASMFEFLDLARAAKFYAAAMGLAAIYRTRLDLPWHDLRHEALIANFEGEVRKLCDFLGVAWSPEMHDFAIHAKSRTIRTPSSIQVVKGLNREGMAQWRHYETELAPVMDVLVPCVKAFGYEPA